MATQIQAQPPPPIQRPLRGSRISTFYPVKSLPALYSLDSAFQLQEYISLLIRLDVHDVETITSLPGVTRDVKDKEGSGGGEKEEKVDEEGQEGSSGPSVEVEKGGEEKDVTVDEACWIYEQLRRLAQDLTHPLITTLQQECSRTTCPEMKAGEWLYLCVAHGTEGAMEQCCAIDYILHTLDSATALLNSPRAFPSRLQIPQSSHRHFSSLARRLGRIFAHAYFHHREAFEQAEAESSLYARFLCLTAKFDLVPSEFLVIPATAGPSSGGTGDSSDEEDDGHGGGSGFGLREVKLGTSYDPRRSQAHAGSGGGGQQHQLPSSFQDEFPDVPRTRRLPQQYHQYPTQTHPQQHSQQPQQPQLSLQLAQGPEPPTLGTESPTKKPGRNRTHTMVLSEAANVVDDLAKAAAAAARAEEEEKEQEEKEREAKAREEAEREARHKAYAEAKAKQEEEACEEGVKEGDEKEELAEEVAAEVSKEEETAVEVLAEESHEEPPTEAKPADEDEQPSSTPEDEPFTKADEEPAAQEVDIAEGATAAEEGASASASPGEEDSTSAQAEEAEEEKDETTTEVNADVVVEAETVEEQTEADVASEGKDAGSDATDEAEVKVAADGDGAS